MSQQQFRGRSHNLLDVSALPKPLFFYCRSAAALLLFATKAKLVNLNYFFFLALYFLNWNKEEEEEECWNCLGQKNCCLDPNCSLTAK